MKPIIILPPDTMSAEDIKLLRENGLCVVVSNDPSKVSFLDPIPAAADRSAIENAAIALSRRILTPNTYDASTRGDFAKMYVDLLVRGTALDPNGTRQEQERQAFDSAKIDEIRRLAKEEARAERAAQKAQKSK